MRIQKNICWYMDCPDGHGKKFINFNIGKRNAKTGKELWDKIKSTAVDAEMIATDYWRPYKHFAPKETHVQSKAETWTIEGYNNLFRHFLAGMRRKSNAAARVNRCLDSILLLMAKWNE